MRRAREPDPEAPAGACDRGVERPGGGRPSRGGRGRAARRPRPRDRARGDRLGRGAGLAPRGAVSLHGPRPGPDHPGSLAHGARAAPRFDPDNREAAPRPDAVETPRRGRHRRGPHRHLGRRGPVRGRLGCLPLHPRARGLSRRARRATGRHLDLAHPRDPEKGMAVSRSSHLDSLLPALSEAYGPPGRETGIRAALKRALKGAGLVREDALGNVHLHIAGKGPRLLLTAHMDAPGLIVTRVDPSGLARVSILGQTSAVASAPSRISARAARRRAPSGSTPTWRWSWTWPSWENRGDRVTSRSGRGRASGSKRKGISPTRRRSPW